jgi:hypothetical protein
MFMQNKTNQLTKERKTGANNEYYLLLVIAYLRIPIAIGTRGFSIRFVFAKLGT